MRDARTSNKQKPQQKLKARQLAQPWSVICAERFDRTDATLTDPLFRAAAKLAKLPDTGLGRQARKWNQRRGKAYVLRNQAREAMQSETAA